MSDERDRAPATTVRPLRVVAAATVPTVDEAAMREVDRLMEDVVGIDLPRMMENAGRGLADAAIRLFQPRRAVVLHGGGGNGGGGLVAARHLHNRGVEVTVVGSGSELGPVPAQQAAILRAMAVPMREEPPAETDLIIDALIGYSLRGAPRGRAAELIGWAGAAGAPIVSLDVPSGFSAATGELLDPHVAATVTVTLALPKTHLASCPATGRLVLADISVPTSVYARMGITVDRDLFGHDQLVELR